MSKIPPPSSPPPPPLLSFSEEVMDDEDSFSCLAPLKKHHPILTLSFLLIFTIMKRLGQNQINYHQNLSANVTANVVSSDTVLSVHMPRTCANTLDAPRYFITLEEQIQKWL